MTKTIYQSYFGASSIELDEQVHRELNLLTKGNTSSRHISTYLCETLGRNETRNLLNRIFCKSSSEGRLKEICRV
ncbi:hypothetical protein L915_04229 [Phytophthora nicotianae]|uniref:Uncharacterized protein n=1 Tax=Phytophthora nicotianae TaxID=4792 RepID=W2IXL7_PHYNI|nr:hypothetical protein L915_04229 [Phytophthora nicotianae]ETL38861.1 hypothetical protein L916_09653 [Phytophthora nicotianae]ETL45792.1 hypothetical protein L916_04179 [Phytophthora nicotianae]ETM45281.1 hypothetical protein L914_09618 [Phytophthora nicotianae]